MGVEFKSPFLQAQNRWVRVFKPKVLGIKTCMERKKYQQIIHLLLYKKNLFVMNSVSKNSVNIE